MNLNTREMTERRRRVKEKVDAKMWDIERREELERAGKALVSAVLTGAEIACDRYGESLNFLGLSGKITDIDLQAGMVEVEINGCTGSIIRKLKFNLDPSVNALLGLKEDVILAEVK